MSDVTFHFEGLLSEKHEMNFYEAARFQYSASRLLVKLEQFRRTGRFQQKISFKSNVSINLKAQKAGSFDINIEPPQMPPKEKAFVDAPLSGLLALVADQLIEKIDEATLDGQLGIQQDKQPSNVAELGLHFNEEETALIQNDEVRRDALRRYSAELCRRETIKQTLQAFEAVGHETVSDLVGMAAPLVRDMAVALRTSARTLDIFSNDQNGGGSRILFLNQKMARQIEVGFVDQQLTQILADIIQVNKENGWGKARIENKTLLVSFSIPASRLEREREKFIAAMMQKEVNLLAYFVRDRRKKPKRLIVHDVLPVPPKD